ncbi:hypothetical protein B0H19DRAFT_1250003 [Mycena capillaripes]|nr:hypothetical protein B0H19DRAFT_1250003 [Mycena capillaripes]
MQNDELFIWAQRLYNWAWVGQQPTEMFSDGIPILNPIFCKRTIDPLIIVRNEYVVIWEAALRVKKEQPGTGFLVHGQPGIGKTIWLVYALSRALSARMPVAYAPELNWYVRFDESGVSLRNYRERAHTGDNLLVLVDSIRDPPPEPWVSSHSSTFPIQASSPRMEKWREWVKQRGASIWTMSLWLPQEIRHLGKLVKPIPGMYTVQELAEFLGPCPRHLMERVKKTTGNPWLDLDYFDDVPADAKTLLSCAQGKEITQTDGFKGFHMWFHATPANPAARPQNLANKLIVHRSPSKFLKYRVMDIYARKTICGQAFEVFGVLQLHQHSLLCHMEDGSTVLIPKGLAMLDSRQSLVCKRTDQDAIILPPVNYPSYDALVQTNGAKSFLQVTITGGHPYKSVGVGLTWAESDPGKGLETFICRFIFVVPSAEIGQHLVARHRNIMLRPPAKYRQKQKAADIDVFKDKINIAVGYAVAPFMSEEQCQKLAPYFVYGPEEEEEEEDAEAGEE